MEIRPQPGWLCQQIYKRLYVEPNEITKGVLKKNPIAANMKGEGGKNILNLICWSLC